MAEKSLALYVEEVRRFSRFYTRHIGVLHEGVLGSAFSLSEARVLYEIAHHGATTASELARELRLDPGYLSRILKGFQNKGLIQRQPDPADARQAMASLTDAGQDAFAAMNARSRDEVAGMLSRIPPARRARLTQAMGVVQELLEDDSPRGGSVILRSHQPGDMGWVIQRHAVLYNREYGWDGSFEALVAEIAAAFLNNFDPRWERCWIAEKDGENVGSIFLVKQDEEMAKLRLLLIEPGARGLGLGKRLVDECIGFAREAGYRGITLWTNDILTAARHIYVKAGFQLVDEAPHHSFGHDLVGQNWQLRL